VLLNFIFAANANEVSQSLFDHFSISHLRMGIGFFLGLALISTLTKSYKHWKDANSTWDFPEWHWWMYFGITVGLGVLWEILENTVLLPIKFNAIKDSLPNSIMDIILVAAAALGTMCLAKYIYRIPELPARHQFVWFYFFAFLPYIGLEFVYILLERVVLG
jgi:hypothetical protein